MVDLVAVEFGYSLESHDFGHLGVGMHVVEAVDALRQWGEQPAV